MMLSGMLDTLYNNIAPIFIGKYYSPAQLGVYNRAQGYAAMPSQNVTGVIANVSFPVLSQIQDDDERLAYFKLDDFQKLQECFVELFGEQHTYYFDEIQNIEGWERFVRRLYNAGNKIVITGSNARMLSCELGTHLTGRYLQVEIYP